MGTRVGGWQHWGFPASVLSILMAASAGATEPAMVAPVKEQAARVEDLTAEPPQAATTVKEWLAQTEAAIANKITAVKLNPTPQGLQVTLETAEGKALQATTRQEGNTLIAEIPNAVLELPEGQAFRSDNPASGIQSVTVTTLEGNRVQVAIAGINSVPTGQIVPAASGLVLNAELAAQKEEELEIVVTGEQEQGYRVPNASVGTRTDTPLRDIPASIQVIPQQVLEEQQVNTLNEALRNVPGVAQTAPNYLPAFNSFTIRGFSIEGGQNSTINGLSYKYGDATSAIFSNIERVEVLRGPASVLFGSGEPGGTINIVTKQPLSEPFYSVEASVGSYNFYQGAIDLTGPLNDSKTILYRLNASYEYGESFVDFSEQEIPSIAGVLKFEIGENTDLTFDVAYSRIGQSFATGLPAVGTVLPNPNGEIPRNRNIAEEISEYSPETFRVGYNLEHRFSENWTLRNAFYFSDLYYENSNLFSPSSLEPDLRTVQRNADSVYANAQTFDLFTNVVGKFSTGSIQHQLLFGVDLRRLEENRSESGIFQATPLDLFDPVYSTERFERLSPPGEFTFLTDSLGIYVQDQVTIADNLKLVLGGRFDAFEQTDRDVLNETETFQSGNAFSPRLGIVYQPIKPISLYASYSSSFTPTIGRSFDNEPFKPGRARQYEIGVKADINDRISATLALFDLTRTNVTTTDPDRLGFEIQTGEQNSRGIELNFAGEIPPGWNILTGYAYTDARITKDNNFPVGNQINNAPRHSFTLWTSYEIQQGSLQGLGFGLGFFYAGDRQGDLDNTFVLPSYFRTDAAIFYSRGQFRASLNFNNLFNVDYFESSYGDLSVFPAEPFTMRGTISWEF